MKRKTCMCGYSTDKANKWDEDLDQCKACTKETRRVQKIRDYLDTFVVGELVCWRDSLHVLVEKTPIEQGGMWRLLDPTTTKTHRMYVNNWVLWSDCRDLRDILYKWTDSDRST